MAMAIAATVAFEISFNFNHIVFVDFASSLNLLSNTFPNIDHLYYTANRHTQPDHSSTIRSTALRQRSFQSLERAKLDFTSFLAITQFVLILGLNFLRKFAGLVIVDQAHSIGPLSNFHRIKYSGPGVQNFDKVATDRTIITQYY